MNDCIRNSLSNIFDVHDQTRKGRSANGIASGELDLELHYNGRPVAIYEGQILEYVNSANISEHVDKAMLNYNPHGLPYIFHTVYYRTGDSTAKTNTPEERFIDFWKRYLNYLSSTYQVPLVREKGLERYNREEILGLDSDIRCTYLITQLLYRKKCEKRGISFMAWSLYYTAKRENPLSADERKKIDSITDRYWEEIPSDLEYEPLGFYEEPDDEEDVVLSGSTAIPMDDRFHLILIYWLKCLSEITVYLSDCDWSVSLDDTELVWEDGHGWILFE